MSPFLFWGQIQVVNVPFHPRFLWSWAAILQIDQDVQLGVRSAKLFIWYIQDIDAIKSTNVFRETDSDPPPLPSPKFGQRTIPRSSKWCSLPKKTPAVFLEQNQKKRRPPASLWAKSRRGYYVASIPAPDFNVTKRYHSTTHLMDDISNSCDSFTYLSKDF